MVVGVALLCVFVLLLGVDRNPARALEALGSTATPTLYIWLGTWLASVFSSWLILSAAAARLRPAWFLILTTTCLGLAAMCFYLIGGGLTYAVYASQLATPVDGGAITFFFAIAGGVTVVSAAIAALVVLAVERSG